MQIKVGAALHMHAGFSLEMKLYPTTCTLTFLEEPHTSPIYDESRRAGFIFGLEIKQ